MAEARSRLGSRANLSRSSSTLSQTGGPRKLGVDFDFNLAAVKAKVVAAMGRTAPRTFKAFFASDADCDHLLEALLLHFIAVYQRDVLVRSMDRARRQHLVNYNPYTVAAKLNELEEEAVSTRELLSRPYACILLANSTPDRPTQDNHFFEALLVALVGVMEQAFQRLPEPATPMPAAVGALFRGRDFNLNERRTRPPRSVDTLKLEEIWAVKNKPGSRVLTAKVLASLHDKPPSLGVQTACLGCSPLVENVVGSDNPLMARRPYKGPPPPVVGGKDAKAAKDAPAKAGTRVRAAFKAVAVAHGASLGVSGLTPSQATLDSAGILSSHTPDHSAAVAAAALSASNWLQQASASGSGGASGSGRSSLMLQAAGLPGPSAGGSRGGSLLGGGGLSIAIPCTTPHTPAAGGLLTAARGAAYSGCQTPSTCRSSAMGPRSSVSGPLHPGVLPELAGLPADDGYQWLALLRRYLLYGPGLGLGSGLAMATGPVF